MRVVKITYTRTVTETAVVPSCLTPPEIEAMAARRLRTKGDKGLFDQGEDSMIVKVALEQGAVRSSQDLGVGVFIGSEPWLTEQAGEDDQSFQKLTGRVPPRLPSQTSIFDKALGADD